MKVLLEQQESHRLIGQPASARVYSDTYPYVITGVVLYKSGAKLGRVRKILAVKIRGGPEEAKTRVETGGFGVDITYDTTHPGIELEEDYTTEFLHSENGKKGSGYYHNGALLIVGSARQYRNPHF